jgi:hypothetical protein
MAVDGEALTLRRQMEEKFIIGEEPAVEDEE